MHGSRTEQEAFGNRLIEYAKGCGFYLERSRMDEFGERKRKPSGECVVYIDEVRGIVVKVKDPYAKAPIKNHAAVDAVYEHVVHNLLFPNTKYTFIGISESTIGDVRFVLGQKYMRNGFEPATQSQIDKHLTGNMHLEKEGNYWYGNDYYAITDVDAAGDNVLIDDGGNLFFIDPIIKFKKPGRDVVEYLAQTKDIEEYLGSFLSGFVKTFNS